MGNAEHISKQFEADLDTTRTRVLQMGGLVEAQILAAIQAFVAGDPALITQVIENDARVNGYEVAIDGAINHIVVKRQPAASDLRLIMAISKIVTDLERIGDHAKNIAEQVIYIVRGTDVRHTSFEDVERQLSKE
jgi:phosphate transport system protein